MVDEAVTEPPQKGVFIQGDVHTYGGDFIAGDKFEIQMPPSPKEARERRSQLILHQKVHQFWIEGVLEKLLDQTGRIDLGRESQPEMVSHPWNTMVALPGSKPQIMPAGKHIQKVFEESGRALLILGEPGSGKTITLLELAKELLKIAENDPAKPIPVVLNLSPWGEKRQPFAAWFVEELNHKYQIPRRVGRQWLENHDLIFMLDGLDEVHQEQRADCVKALNDFGDQYGLSGIAVCSRLRAYQQIEQPLKLGGAVTLQPLTDQQIESVLNRAGASLRALRDEIRADSTLRELAKTPLMLSIMKTAYEDAPVDTLQSQPASPESRRHQLFETYIARMFARRPSSERFSNRSTREWLSWLAKNMQAKNRSLFLMEEIQPDWLASKSKVWAYVMVSRVLGGLLLGLGLGALNFNNPSSLLVGPIVGALSGAIVGMVTIIKFKRPVPQPDQRGNRKSWRDRLPVVGLSIGLPFALAAGVWGFVDLANTVFLELADEQLRFRILGALLAGGLGALMVALFAGSLAGLIFELVFGRRFRWQRAEEDIRTVEALKWSWRDSFRVAPRGALIGALVTPVIAIPIGVASSEEIIEAFVLIPLLCCFGALLVGAFGAFLGGLAGGLQGREIPKKSTPNQGIWLSVRSSLVAGAVAGLGVGLLGNLISPPDSLSGWGINLISGLPIGFLVVLFFGLLDFIQHFVLRFFLWRERHLPWRMSAFLDHAADLIFLRKVGGGYIFIHRLLQEHFARHPDSAQKS